MNEQHRSRLFTHITNMGYSLIQQISQTGAVLVRSKNHVEVDLPSMHHIAEFARKLDHRMFEHYLKLVASWLAYPKNDALDSQFSIDTLSSILPGADIVAELIEKTIIPTQLESGAFTKYTAFLHGGDYFSTLWCVKVLQNTDVGKYKDEYNKALKYLISNVTDKKLSISSKGFLYLLLHRDDKYRNHPCLDSIKKDLHKKIKEPIEANHDLLWSFYVLEDILADSEDSTGRELVESKIIQFFELDEEAKALPKVFSEYQEKSPHEGIAYHLYARACIIALSLLDNGNKEQTAYKINSLVQSKGLEAVYEALKKDVELKEYLQKYGGIHREFSQYEKDLEEAWSTHKPFEKSVFIMMPFKNSLTYRSVAMAIREACEIKGFKAIRVDDHDRQFRDRLWDNLVVNMLSCKYAVAVYVSEQVVDRLDDNEPKMFPNPNVALEYGFFRSRGQSICLLKDKNSPIPSDLQGFLWNEFDIEDPKSDVIKAVNLFLEKVSKEEPAEPDA